jgi:hypothetical protein
MFVVGRDTLRSFHISESDGKVKVDEIRKYTQSKFLITSMACNETSIIMRVLKCAVDMHLLYRVKLFRNSESLSFNLVIITSNLKVQV